MLAACSPSNGWGLPPTPGATGVSLGPPSTVLRRPFLPALQAFTSSLFLAGLFSSLFAAKITQKWGRKASLALRSEPLLALYCSVCLWGSPNKGQMFCASTWHLLPKRVLLLYLALPVLCAGPTLPIC